MSGTCTVKGMRRICVQSGMQKRFRIIESTAAMYMLAMKPQTISGWSSISRGPGCRPQIMSAPRITAAVGDPGIPRVTSGSSEPTSALDAADSGATTPSSAPVPNFSGFLANFFARPYPTKDAGVAPVPGSTPIQKPISVERMNVFQYPSISRSALAMSLRPTFAFTAPFVMMFSSAARSSSPIPNMPTTTTRNLMPARRSVEP